MGMFVRECVSLLLNEEIISDIYQCLLQGLNRQVIFTPLQ